MAGPTGNAHQFPKASTCDGRWGETPTTGRTAATQRRSGSLRPRSPRSRLTVDVAACRTCAFLNEPGIFGKSEILLPIGPKSLHNPCRPGPHRGAFRDRHGRRAGDAMDAGGARDESAYLRTAKSCGPDAPTLASSWRKRFRRRRWQESPVTGESAI